MNICPVEWQLNAHLKKVDDDEAREDEIYRIIRELTDSEYNDGAPEFEKWARRKAERILMEKI